PCAFEDLAGGRAALRADREAEHCQAAIAFPVFQEAALQRVARLGESAAADGVGGLRGGVRLPAAHATGDGLVAPSVGDLNARLVGAGLCVLMHYGGLIRLEDRRAIAEVPAVADERGWRVRLRVGRQRHYLTGLRHLSRAADR